jgi:hypothetical protein
MFDIFGDDCRVV